MIRPEVDATFELLRKVINALYLTNNIIGQIADIEEELGAVIDAVNKYLMGYNATLSRRRKTKKKEKGEPKPGEDVPKTENK